MPAIFVKGGELTKRLGEYEAAMDDAYKVFQKTHDEATRALSKLRDIDVPMTHLRTHDFIVVLDHARREAEGQLGELKAIIRRAHKNTDSPIDMEAIINDAYARFCC